MKSVSGLLLLSLSLCAVAVGPPVQVVPQGIESVNGSNVAIGCTSPLLDSDGVMVCGSRSYLVDGCSPDIDTSTSDWASQLVTVRRNDGTPDITFPHVLLTFGFDTAVSLTGIEMDLFNCSDWNISAPSITVYLNQEYNLVPPNTSIIFDNYPFVRTSKNSLQSSCESLSTSSVTFSGGSYLPGSYRTVYILVDLSHTSSIQWVHVGEVRFLDSSGIPLNFSSSGMDTTASPSSVQTSVTSSESPAIVHSSSDFTTSASSTVTQSKGADRWRAIDA
ncbi:hypothetical protein GBAR_LOCUS24784 [Geodia barretti]|uniref:Uncharacterized protein n=1 Tax=Geodia barretti TaxID=519541 RepID=A0AA35TAH1_GEOBA|nr:hypothetical protein GBAR_LOCUS24784 [Geodia barretti]CAI8044730.1 hypothetical protein GBAR_LOCUS24784 [Geodia barretti]